MSMTCGPGGSAELYNYSVMQGDMVSIAVSLNPGMRFDCLYLYSCSNHIDTLYVT